MIRLLFSFMAMSFACLLRAQPVVPASRPTTVLYDQQFQLKKKYPELDVKNATHRFLKKGIEIDAGLVKLNKYYSLAERLVRYHVRFADDSKAIFQSDKGDFKAIVDVAAKRISIATTPAVDTIVPFLDATHEYLVEVERCYQTSSVKIIDLFTGDAIKISATMNGRGGHGRGAAPEGFMVGRQYDYYCFGVEKGGSMIVYQACVLSRKAGLQLLIYGDSITEPEGYFPAADFSSAWTQLVINNVKGAAMSSGRGGNTIKEVLERIRHELPYIKAKYVMVTIGTNGGNTEQNLSELVAYIISQGSIPVLNNIPSNESGTQIKENALIEKVRSKYNIKGCRFDLATSLLHDGKQVDTTTMYQEDYDWGQIYHHPNVKGSLQMFTRTLIDVPEIYN